MIWDFILQNCFGDITIEHGMKVRTNWGQDHFVCRYGDHPRLQLHVTELPVDPHPVHLREAAASMTLEQGQVKLRWPTVTDLLFVVELSERIPGCAGCHRHLLLGLGPGHHQPWQAQLGLLRTESLSDVSLLMLVDSRQEESQQFSSGWGCISW